MIQANEIKAQVNIEKVFMVPQFLVINDYPQPKEGGIELMTQRQRRTAFAIQNKIGSDKVKIEEMENSDAIEYIFFADDFRKRVGGTKFDQIHKFIY